MKRTKRFLAILLSALLLLSSLPLASFAADPFSIRNVDVIDVTEPEGGYRLTYDWTVPANISYGKTRDADGASCFWIKKSSYESSFEEWYNNGEIYREGEGAFPYIEHGYYYVFCARLKSSSGYMFASNPTATINGNTANVERVSNSEVIVWYPFYAHDINVESVEVYYVKTPVAGETITFDYGFDEGQVAYDYSANEDGVRSYWVVTDKAPTSWDEIDAADGYLSIDPRTYTFEGGKYYTFVACVNAAFGYNISVYATAKMNDEEAMIRFKAPGHQVAKTFYVEPKTTPVNPPVIDNTTEKTTVTLYINKANYTVNESTKISDSAPIIRDSRTFVPFRLVAEALGGEVQWVPNGQRIITILDDTTVRMQIGSKGYSVLNAGKGEADGIMDVAPYINSANRTLVPLRFVAEALGCEVTPYYAADGTTERVVFTKN